jgi:hypothetical protein
METTKFRSEEHYATESKARYWYQDWTLQRAERDSSVLSRKDAGFEASAGSGTSFTTTTVRDGAHEWDSSPMYWGRPMAQLAMNKSLTGSNLGPLEFESVDDFVEWYRSGADFMLPNGTRATEVRDHGTERLLGRDVELIEIVTLDASGAETGWRKYWIDPERLFVLRYEMHIESLGEGQRPAGSLTEGERATRVEYGVDQPPDRFVFMPSPGAVELKCPHFPEHYNDGVFFPPFWAVPFSITPSTHHMRTFGQQPEPDGTCGVLMLGYTLVSDAQVEDLRVRQEAINVDSVFGAAPSEPVDLGGGVEARLGNADEGGRSVAWVARGVGVEVRSASMSDEALLDFARAIVAANP